MPDTIKTINGIAVASIKTVQGIAKAALKTFNGISLAGPKLYWRVSNIVTSATTLEISELRFFVGAADVTGDGTMSSSSAPSPGTLANLVDGSTGTRAYWGSTSGLTIKMTFATNQEISALKLGSFDDSPRFPTDITLEYSTDDASWTAAGTATGISWPGVRTLSGAISIP